jgi:16S rRNA (cytosine967-C5)-methyltransferase
VARWIKRFGVQETIALCEENNKNPFLSLRVNRLKTSIQELQNRLANFNLSTFLSPYIDNFMLTQSLPDLNQFELFQQGMFSIQDASAGLACRLLSPEPHDTIVDLCAAPGGKTTFLAELTDDRARIVAIDLNQSRLKLIRQNLNRLGLKSVQLVRADGAQLACRKVDKVIVDAPCSGLGVLAKRADLRWKRTPQQLDELTELQLRLLRNAAKILKPGGVLVYCTCTIEPEENELMVERFLQENKEFHTESASRFVPEGVTNSTGYVYTFPHRHKMDGSFAARLIKFVG